MDQLTLQLNSLLEQAVERGEVAGANLLVLKNGEELAYTQAGFAVKEQGIPYSRDTIARLYSMTKPVTAAAAMLLAERGALDLGQNLGDILPAFRDPQVWEDGKKVPARRAILVHDLLSMTSGIPYPGTDDAGARAAEVFDDAVQRLHGDNPMTSRELADRLGEGGLTFHPGDRWMYGSSADVLGAVIEEVSGMPFGEFLKKELFVPLGMKDTAFYVPKDKQHRLAETYEQTPEGVKRYETYNLAIDYGMDKAPAFESGGAGLVSTIDDYAKFAAMLLNGGRHGDQQILQPRTVEFMTRGKMTPWQLESLWRTWESMYGYGYSNLMRIMEEPGMAHFQTWKGEYGWDGWLGCYFCNSPENKVTVLMTCQRRDAGTMVLTRRLRNVIAAHLK